MQVTKAEARILNSLTQEYLERLHGEDVTAFLERTYLVWFDHFPEPHIPDCDAHEIQWQLENHKKYFHICLRAETTGDLFVLENSPSSSVESLDKQWC